MDFIMDNVAEGKLAGFLAFDNGSAFVGLLVGCVFVFIIDNDWLKASITNVVALALTGIGMIHSPACCLRKATARTWALWRCTAC